MTGHDAELALFQRGVNCAALLESFVPGWKLGPKESTRRALKYRHGDGACRVHCGSLQTKYLAICQSVVKLARA